MFETTKLENNLRLITKQMPEAGSVAVGIFIGAGGRYEDFETNYGVSHFLEHALFKGTIKRPSPKQIPEEIDQVGGYINAYTTEDRTCFYVKVPQQHWQLGYEILVDMITDPLFKESEIDRERAVIIEEMNVYRDDPARHVYDLTLDLLWPNDKLRTNVIGNEQIISSIPRDSIISYYKSLYTTDNMVVSVAGNLKLDTVVRKTRELFSNIRTTKSFAYAPTTGRISASRSNILDRNTNQTHFVIATRGAALDTDDEKIMAVVSTILGSGLSSRLYLNIRERQGLAYSVTASTSNFTDAGNFEVYAGVNKEKTAKALSAVCSELAKIRQTLVGPKELTKAKEILKGRLIMSLEDNSSQADRMGTQMILANTYWPVDETLAKIDSVTAEEVQKAAGFYLATDKLRLAVIGPHSDEDKLKFEEIISK